MEEKRKRQRINTAAICSSENYGASKRVHQKFQEQRHEELKRLHEEFEQSELKQTLLMMAAKEPKEPNANVLGTIEVGFPGMRKRTITVPYGIAKSAGFLSTWRRL